jgi:hypothetical protein
MEIQIKPKPCPFCGSEPDVKEKTMGSPAVVGCKNLQCYLQPLLFANWGKSLAEIVEIWNTRIGQTEVSKVVEQNSPFNNDAYTPD